MARDRPPLHTTVDALTYQLIGELVKDGTFRSPGEAIDAFAKAYTMLDATCREKERQRAKEQFEARMKEIDRMEEMAKGIVGAQPLVKVNFVPYDKLLAKCPEFQEDKIREWATNVQKDLSAQGKSIDEFVAERVLLAQKISSSRAEDEKTRAIETRRKSVITYASDSLSEGEVGRRSKHDTIRRFMAALRNDYHDEGCMDYWKRMLLDKNVAKVTQGPRTATITKPKETLDLILKLWGEVIGQDDGMPLTE